MLVESLNGLAYISNCMVSISHLPVLLPEITDILVSKGVIQVEWTSTMHTDKITVVTCPKT
jgi:hypothetical protein